MVQAQFVCVCTFVCLCICMCRIWCAGYVHNNASVYVHVQLHVCFNNAQSVCVCVYVRVCVMWAFLCVVVHVYLQCELKTVTYSIPAVYSSGHKKVFIMLLASHGYITLPFTAVPLP